MGLLKNNNYYVRLTLTGTYYIYPTKKYREIEKKVPSSETVIQKYVEIIQGLEKDKEALYYLGTRQLLEDWKNEFNAYLNRDTSNKFPLMKAYIKDVAKTLPNFIASGTISVRGNTLADFYEYVKKYKIFGETEDDL